jgi:hypothetical protein
MQHLAKKKQREWRLLEKFRECYSEFPAGMICPQEQPDFVLKTVHAMLGIEVREWSYDEALSGGSPTRRHESLTFRTALRAQELYDSFGLWPVNVWVNFHRPLSENQLEDLAEKISRIVTRHIPNPGSFASVRHPGPDWKSLPPQVASVSIYHPTQEQETIWVPVGGGVLPVITPHNIEEVLTKKEPLLPKYRESADKVWLLIAVTGFNTSAFCKIDPNLDRHTFRTDFDQVFFLHESSGRVVRFHLVANGT